MLRAFLRNVMLAVVAGLGVVGLVAWMNTGQAEDNDPAVARARKTVQMLDDVYKTAVVLITEKYVHKEEDFPAGSAAIALFDAIRKKGWHDVRLLDVTGQPYNAENVARDAFEKDAANQLRNGKSYVERVENGPQGRTLRAATAIPVVLEKCTMCHPHYKEAKPGQAVGMLSYKITIE
jgi:hypothetical protein